MGGSFTASEDSRSDTSDWRPPGQLCPDSGISARPTRRAQRQASKKRSSGVQNEAPQQPVRAKEYIKWRNNADKFVARAQKEMFDLMEESFSRQFPSRQGLAEPPSDTTGRG